MVRIQLETINEYVLFTSYGKASQNEIIDDK